MHVISVYFDACMCLVCILMHACIYSASMNARIVHFLSNKPIKSMSIILSMAVKSFLEQNQLLHLLKHTGHKHSRVQVRFIKCVGIERHFNHFLLLLLLKLLSD